MNNIVDLSFPVSGAQLWADHNHRLLAALSEKCSDIHKLEGLAINTIMGIPDEEKQGIIKLTSKSRLVLRLPVEAIQNVYLLAGQTLNVGGHRIDLGQPVLQTIKPADAVKARLVTIKGYTEPGLFLQAAHRQLQGLEINANVGITANNKGEPKRLTLKITKDIDGKQKSFTIVGFSVVVSDLTPDDSIKLQVNGLGGKRRLGCGVFFPTVSVYQRQGGDRHATTTIG